MSIQFAIDSIIENLKEEEGYSSNCYLCSGGAHTVGYGRNISEGGVGITEEEAAYLLKNDVIRTIDEVRRNYPWFDDLSKAAREVLVEMCFQLGAPRLALFKKMLAGLEAGDSATAAAELLDSKFAGQVPARANRLANKLRG
jgi:lysozyme